jgi:hypothetical protein
MLTLHVTKSFDGDLITLSKDEFLQLITMYKQFEPVEIIEHDDPDELTEEELQQLQIAEAEREQGETISLEEFIQREKLHVSR